MIAARKRTIRSLQIGGAIALVVGILLVVAVFQLFGYYMHSTGSPVDPAASGFKPVEVAKGPLGKYEMKRYRLKDHALDRVLSGNPESRSGDGYYSVITVHDSSGTIIAQLSHPNGSPKITITAAGFSSPDGIDWKAGP